MKIIKFILVLLIFNISLLQVNAKPSPTVGGSVDENSITVNGEKRKNLIIKFKTDLTQFKTVDEQEKSDIQKLNNGVSLKNVIGQQLPSISDYKLLTKIQEIEVINKETLQSIDQLNNIVVTWEVPHLMETMKDIKILFFNPKIKQWNIINPSSIDFQKKSISAKIDCIGPVAVIYKENDVPVKQEQKDEKEFPVQWIVIIAGILFLIIILLKRKKDENNEEL